MLFVLNPHRFWFPTFLTWLNFVVVILLDVQPNLSTIFSRIILKHVVEGFSYFFNPIGNGPFFQCLLDIIAIMQQMCWYKIRIITYLSNNNRYTIFIYLHLLIGSVYGSVSTYVCPYQRDLSVHVMCSQISHVSVVSVQAPLQLAMSWHHVIIQSSYLEFCRGSRNVDQSWLRGRSPWSWLAGTKLSYLEFCSSLQKPIS